MRPTLTKLRDSLRPLYGRRETEAIIKLIFFHVKGWGAVDMIIHEPDSLSDFVRSEIDGILERLLRHEPIQYITGTARFHGLDFKVDRRVLIPRPETSELVDLIEDRAGDAPDLHVLDVCTGSGCIAIALARDLPFAAVTAIDISAGALDVARENAKLLHAKVEWGRADVFNWMPSGASFDVVVSNPPYIDESERLEMSENVTGYEPENALFVPDSDPLMFYRRILLIAGVGLKKGGSLYFEINPRHAGELRQMAGADGFENVEIIKDSYGRDRFLIAEKP